MQNFLFILGIILLTQIGRCNDPNQPATASPEVAASTAITTEQRQQMARSSGWRSPEWLLVASGETAADEDILFEMLNDVARFNPFEKKFRPVRASSLTQADLGQQPLMLFGNLIPQEVWNSLGARADNFRNTDLTKPGWLLRAFGVENPWVAPDTSMAFNLFYGANVKKLREQLYQQYAKDNWDGLLRTRYGYMVDQEDEARLKGFFSSEDWLPDPERELVFSPAGEPAYQSDHLRIFTPDGSPSQGQLAKMAQQIEASKARMQGWFGLDNVPPLELYLYPSLERITLRLQVMQEVQFGGKNHQLHLSFAELEQDINSTEWYFCLLQWFRQLEKVKTLDTGSRYLDRGLSVLLSYGGIPPGLQDATLYKWKLLLDASQLSKTNRNDFGAYLYDYAAAHQLTGKSINFLREELGLPNIPESFFRSKPPHWQPQPSGFQAGMTFAHEGYQVINGYGGSTVDASFDSLATLNVNSIAVVPYGFQRHPNKLPELHVASSPGGENNAATRSSIRRAQRMGWSVMLKPQIWVGSGSWPGDIDFETEAEWDQWFQRYTEWILNFAILANEEQVAALCIGTELRYTTLKNPQRWREMIWAIRAVYPGVLTYAANWGEEFEQLSFWEELDIIGLNSYYPISEADQPTEKELQQGVQKWVNKAEAKAKAMNKNWWLTEVGYRSVTTPWKNPHAEPNQRSANALDQERCYRALLTTLAQTEYFSGMYVWKWPSYLGRGNRRRYGKVGFTPGGKPAGKLLGDYYALARKH